MKSLCYINGRITQTSDGLIGISDMALQRGYGIFDFSRLYNNKLFHFEDHIERLRRSASELHLVIPLINQEIYEIAAQLISDSDLNEPSIRMILTGGYSSSLNKPNFIIVAEELPKYPAEVYEKGAKIITVEYQRELPHVKSINYINAIRLKQLKRDKKAFDMLYHSNHGITECPRSNFFAFRGDTLITPSDHILHGITRKLILKLASTHSPIEKRAMSLGEIDGIDEAFITSTSKRVVPVCRINNKNIGKGVVGDRTKTIMKLFDEYTQSY